MWKIHQSNRFPEGEEGESIGNVRRKNNSSSRIVAGGSSKGGKRGRAVLED